MENNNNQVFIENIKRQPKQQEEQLAEQKRGLRQAAIKKHSDIRMLQTFLEFSGIELIECQNSKPPSSNYNL